jgi:hypothetical protein
MWAVKVRDVKQKSARWSAQDRWREIVLGECDRWERAEDATH